MPTYGWSVRICGRRWQELRKRKGIAQEMKCWWCGIQMKDYKPSGGKIKADQITMDHVIPLSKKGTNRHENLVAACHSCNQSRNDADQTMSTGDLSKDEK